jgi:hypothetical protein
VSLNLARLRGEVASTLRAGEGAIRECDLHDYPSPDLRFASVSTSPRKPRGKESKLSDPINPLETIMGDQWASLFYF